MASMNADSNEKDIATERDDSPPEDMAIRKEPVLLVCFSGYQFGK